MSHLPSCLTAIILDFAALPVEVMVRIRSHLGLEEIPLSTVLIPGTARQLQKQRLNIAVKVPLRLSEEELRNYRPLSKSLRVFDWYEITVVTLDHTEPRTMIRLDHGSLIADFIVLDADPKILSSIPSSSDAMKIRMTKRDSKDRRYDLSKLSAKILSVEMRGTGTMDVILPRRVETVDVVKIPDADPPRGLDTSLCLTFTAGMIEYGKTDVCEGTMDILLENYKTRKWCSIYKMVR